MMATPALAEEVRIAPGGARHLDEVMAVMDSAFGDRFGEAWTRSQLSGILPMAGVSLTIAVDRAEKSVVGFSLVRTVADESELLLIAVLEDQQGRGIGGLLLEQFLGQARDDGVGRVHLEVRDGNSAISIYHAAGFSAVGRRRNYYHAADGMRYDAITLARQL
jgi:[ribosomal protein S18]-alanine N-acetyltransferase